MLTKEQIKFAYQITKLIDFLVLFFESRELLLIQNKYLISIFGKTENLKTNLVEPLEKYVLIQILIFIINP